MSIKQDSISVVIPVYGCRGAVSELHRRLVQTLSTITYSFEIILVNDCCPQGSWEEIEKVCAVDERVVGINLSRNFGQIRAITAGLDYSKGDWVVVMDCDLQDRPEGIVSLYNEAQKGYDVVFARREGRKDGKVTKLFSKLFYKMYNYFTDGAFDNSICNFSISKRKVIDAYCSMREQNRAYTLFLKWLGFKQTAIDVPADYRFEGESSYNFKKKIKFAIELITAQSNKPLVVMANMGLSIAGLAFIYTLYMVIRQLTIGDFVQGWISTNAAIFFMGGLILAAIGIVGIYIGNIFDETKHRPIYVIDEIKNGHEDGEEE